MSDRPVRISSERTLPGGVGSDSRSDAVTASLPLPLMLIGALPFYVRQPFGSGIDSDVGRRICVSRITNSGALLADCTAGVHRDSRSLLHVE
ncbi:MULTISPECIES: hypothetical protein [unclassified Rhodococcus (in: high G+C Gram-positive bacteria)]|uniref:hypothetical protein n=1 Tax=unclassified Rhodococcus (in: high G+C Gram-positive bacteria) TaxID=192944 RepID=UPI00117B9258|nr:MULTISPECIES: hypothetical protein [unclassified Rhodococcus (in: high G+C Gram-positive bacteria)]